MPATLMLRRFALPVCLVVSSLSLIPTLTTADDSATEIRRRFAEQKAAEIDQALTQINTQVVAQPGKEDQAQVIQGLQELVTDAANALKDRLSDTSNPNFDENTENEIGPLLQTIETVREIIEGNNDGKTFIDKNDFISQFGAEQENNPTTQELDLVDDVGTLKNTVSDLATQFAEASEQLGQANEEVSDVKDSKADKQRELVRQEFARKREEILKQNLSPEERARALLALEKQEFTAIITVSINDEFEVGSETISADVPDGVVTEEQQQQVSQLEEKRDELFIKLSVARDELEQKQEKLDQLRRTRNEKFNEEKQRRENAVADENLQVVSLDLQTIQDILNPPRSTETPAVDPEQEVKNVIRQAQLTIGDEFTNNLSFASRLEDLDLSGLSESDREKFEALAEQLDELISQTNAELLGTLSDAESLAEGDQEEVVSRDGQLSLSAVAKRLRDFERVRAELAKLLNLPESTFTDLGRLLQIPKEDLQEFFADQRKFDTQTSDPTSNTTSSNTTEQTPPATDLPFNALDSFFTTDNPETLQQIIADLEAANPDLKPNDFLLEVFGQKVVSQPNSPGENVQKINQSVNPELTRLQPAVLAETIEHQAALQQIGLSEQLAEKLNQSAKQMVTVAVIDTGVDELHPSLLVNRWKNEFEIPGNLRDEDGNGLRDDHRGFNFHGNYPDVTDRHGHGTLVAGIIAGRPGWKNRTHVSDHVKLMILKVMTDRGKTDEVRVALAIRYAVDHGAKIINLSLGTFENYGLLEKAVAYARSKNVLVVAASGSRGTSADQVRPANIPGVLTVAAVDAQNQRAKFSSWGACVDVAAPGVGVIAPRALGTDFLALDAFRQYARGQQVVDANYYKADGTSFAAPFVSGLAALIWAQQPTLTAEQVKRKILMSCVDTAQPGWDQSTGHGVINVEKALSADPENYLDTRIWATKVDRRLGKTSLVIQGTADATNFKQRELYAAPVIDGQEPQWKKLFSVKSAVAPSASSELGFLPLSQFEGHARWKIRSVVTNEQGQTYTSEVTLRFQ